MFSFQKRIQNKPSGARLLTRFHSINSQFVRRKVSVWSTRCSFCLALKVSSVHADTEVTKDLVMPREATSESETHQLGFIGTQMEWKSWSYPQALKTSEEKLEGFSWEGLCQELILSTWTCNWLQCSVWCLCGCENWPDLSLGGIVSNRGCSDFFPDVMPVSAC